MKKPLLLPFSLNAIQPLQSRTSAMDSRAYALDGPGGVFGDHRPLPRRRHLQRRERPRIPDVPQRHRDVPKQTRPSDALDGRSCKAGFEPGLRAGILKQPKQVRVRHPVSRHLSPQRRRRSVRPFPFPFPLPSPLPFPFFFFFFFFFGRGRLFFPVEKIPRARFLADVAAVDPIADEGS